MLNLFQYLPPFRSSGKRLANYPSPLGGSHRLLLYGDEGAQGSPNLETEGGGLNKNNEINIFLSNLVEKKTKYIYKLPK